MKLMVQILLLFAFLITTSATLVNLIWYLRASPEECMKSSSISCSPDAYLTPLLAWGAALVVVVIIVAARLFKKSKIR